MVIIMLTSSAALLLASVGFVGYEVASFRQEMRRHLLLLSSHVADKIVAPVANRDKVAVTQSLRSVLSGDPGIILGCVYQKDGQLLAAYRRSDETGYFTPPPAPQKTGITSEWGRVKLSRPILLGETIGFLYIESDSNVLSGRLWRYAGIVFILLLLSSVMALAISARLQRLISDPIIHLSQVARIVSNKKNYAVRAVKYNDAGSENDEFGALFEGFNEMLGQIQARDAELQQARDLLERRVEERTQDLRQEIAERKRAEARLQQQFARIFLLNQIARSVAERRTLRSIFETVLSQVRDRLPAGFAAVFLCKESGGLELSAATEPKKLTNAPGVSLALQSSITPEQAGTASCAKGQATLVADTAESSVPLHKALRAANLRSAVAAPLLVEKELFGVLLVAREAPDSFSEEETEFLRMLSEQVALAAHQARLHEELEGAYNELQQTQQAVMQQQRLRALGEMASGIAHDINNALSPIIVYSELLLRNERQLNDATAKHLQNIRTAGEDIAHIVSRMREFYRRREESEELSPVHLNDLAQQVVDLTRPRWRDIPQQKGIVVEMATDLDPSVEEIYGNASELREALTNLILNAVDAMPTGGRLTVRSRFIKPDESKARAHVVMEVSDTGVGMDEKTRTRCLEPFFSTKGQRGTGLGLAMVYGIVQRHEGNIEIESQVGKGTTMRMMFPVRELFDLAQFKKVARAQSVPPLRILCIDDEPLLRQVMKEILESDRHTVTLADGGEAGIGVFRQARQEGHNFDVVITDLGMPHVDGRQVACTLKKESPSTPIVLLTGWGTMIKSDGELPAQVDAVVSKPPRINELRETLWRVTQGTGWERLDHPMAN